MAILSYYIGLKAKPVAYSRYIPQVDRLRSDLLDGKVTKLRDRTRCDVHANVQFAFGNLCRAGRKDKILRIDRTQHLAGRDVLDLNQVLIIIDLDLPRIDAVREGNDDARHRTEQRYRDLD